VKYAAWRVNATSFVNAVAPVGDLGAVPGAVDVDVPADATGDEEQLARLVDPHPHRLPVLGADEERALPGAEVAPVDVTAAQRPDVEGAALADRDALRLEVDRQPDRGGRPRRGRGCDQQRAGDGTEGDAQGGRQETAHDPSRAWSGSLGASLVTLRDEGNLLRSPVRPTRPSGVARGVVRV
jgi:hypothetical protein